MQLGPSLAKWRRNGYAAGPPLAQWRQIGNAAWMSARAACMRPKPGCKTVPEEGLPAKPFCL
eukprot:4589467-Heterocapsa_arctica.AAC.1